MKEMELDKTKPEAFRKECYSVKLVGRYDIGKLIRVSISWKAEPHCDICLVRFLPMLFISV